MIDHFVSFFFQTSGKGSGLILNPPFFSILSSLYQKGLEKKPVFSSAQGEKPNGPDSKKIRKNKRADQLPKE